jgi:hypothetical protein
LEECASAQRTGNAALQALTVQEADDGEERVIEPLSLLPSVLLLLIVALAFVSFPSMMRGSSLLAIWGRCFEGG